MVWFFGSVFFPCNKRLSSILFGFVGIFYGLETSWQASLYWLLGVLYVCQSQREVLVFLIWNLAAIVFRPSSYETFTWNQILYGFNGYIISICVTLLFGQLKPMPLPLLCGNPSCSSRISLLRILEIMCKLLACYEVGLKVQEVLPQMLVLILDFVVL